MWEYCHGWQGWRWITTWKSWPTFSRSHSDLIEFLVQNLSVKIYRRSSRAQRSILPASKGKKELYLWGFDEKTEKYGDIAPLKLPKNLFRPWHIFSKPMDRAPWEERTDSVYSIPCKDCEHVYFGRTKRHFRIATNFSSLVGDYMTNFSPVERLQKINLLRLHN